MDFKDFWTPLPGNTREAFAISCETTPGQLTQVAYKARRAGEKLAIAIERESGRKVTCEELRPDVDWAYLRGTAKRRKVAA